MSDALAHLTLSTGHVRPSPRSEVGAETLAVLEPVVAAGRGVVHGLTIAVDERDETGAAYWLGWGAPAVRCVLATEADATGRRWPQALALLTEHGATTASGTISGDVLREPPRPWLAVALVPSEIWRLDRDRLGMLGDAERCVAWAILGARRG